MAYPKRTVGRQAYIPKVRRTKVNARPTMPINEVKPDKEVLSGTVRGKKASAPEERLARSLDKFGVGFMFRYVIGQPLARGSTEVDFVLMTPVVQTVQVYGEYAHKSSEQLEEDRQKEDKIDAYFSRYGAASVVGIRDYELDNQEMTDLYVRTNLL